MKQQFSLRSRRAKGKTVSPRQQRMAEVLKRMISEYMVKTLLIHDENRMPFFTVTEVIPSPDFKNATVYITVRSGNDAQQAIETCKGYAGEISKAVAKQITSKHSPRLQFALDKSLDQAEKIDKILQSNKVARDLN